MYGQVWLIETWTFKLAPFDTRDVLACLPSGACCLFVVFDNSSCGVDDHLSHKKAVKQLSGASFLPSVFLTSFLFI